MTPGGSLPASLTTTESPSYVEGSNSDIKPSRVELSPYSKANGSFQVVYNSPDAAETITEPEPGILGSYKVSQKSISQVLPRYPAWDNPRDALDNCLPTYMFWSSLFSAANLWHSGFSMKPPALTEDVNMGTAGHQAETTKDPFEHSLYRWLKRRLHGMVRSLP